MASATAAHELRGILTPHPFRRSKSPIRQLPKRPRRSYLHPQGISKGIEGRGLSELGVVVTFAAVS